jgi:methanogenic corrinoid protein MtbC1
LEDQVYNPDNFRRKLRDRAADEDGGRSGQDGDPSSTLSVSVMSASAAHPVFGKSARPLQLPVDAPPPGAMEGRAEVDHRRRGWTDRLHLVPPPTPPRVLDRRDRVAKLYAVLEDRVIPHLGYHGSTKDAHPMKPTEAEFEEFFGHLLRDDEAGCAALIRRLRAKGLPMDAICLDVLTPAARRMNALWADDSADFVTVTVAVGRLQALLREFSPEFCAEVEPAFRALRILLSQPEDDSHMFGLSMVAEFFRRDGWEVVGGVAGSGVDPAQLVRDDWFDVVGLSVATESKLTWLRDLIAVMRQHSSNRQLVIMVGGPLFSMDPSLVQQVGADLTADAREAPLLAEKLVSERDRSSPGQDGHGFKD